MSPDAVEGHGRVLAYVLWAYSNAVVVCLKLLLGAGRQLHQKPQHVLFVCCLRPFIARQHALTQIRFAHGKTVPQSSCTAGEIGQSF